MIRLDLLRTLPLPTEEQTARFADHVAGNHSWYKHLPFFPPGASFVFFPNPNAGRGVRKDGDRFELYDIEHGDYFDHHSRLSTVEYLTRFGHWDYWVYNNPRVTDSESGPWLFSETTGRRQLLDDGLRQRWTCQLTAFVKPAPSMFSLRANELRNEAFAFLAANRSTVRRILRGLLTRRREESPTIDRYRAVATIFSQAAGGQIDTQMFSFIQSEAKMQRELLSSALHRVWIEWANA